MKHFSPSFHDLSHFGVMKMLSSWNIFMSKEAMIPSKTAFSAVTSNCFAILFALAMRFSRVTM